MPVFRKRFTYQTEHVGTTKLKKSDRVESDGENTLMVKWIEVRCNKRRTSGIIWVSLLSNVAKLISWNYLKFSRSTGSSISQIKKSENLILFCIFSNFHVGLRTQLLTLKAIFEITKILCNHSPYITGVT